MTELYWILSAAALILAVILIRACCGSRLAPGLRCALWGLVLLRLLLPGFLFSSVWSLPAVAERADIRPVSISADGINADGINAVTTGPSSPEAAVPPAGGPPAAVTADDIDAAAAAAYEAPVSVPPAATEAAAPAPAPAGIDASRLLCLIWLGGGVVTASIFLVANLRLRRQLRARRVRLDTDCRLPVYTVEGLDSSCLFGKAIYLSPQTAADPVELCHVLEHELAHDRHGDQLWALLRCAALALHWFDPLVWWAARLSRQDSELWADAGALSRLGEASRQSYGATLIGLAARSAHRPRLLLTATPMGNGKKELRERVRLIAHTPRRPVVLAVIVILLALTAAGCAFAGAPESGDTASEAAAPAGESYSGDGRVLTGAELSYFNNDFFNIPGSLSPAFQINLHNQFLSSEYSSPAEIDLYELFYCGLGDGESELSPEEQELVGRPEICPTDKLPAAQMDEAFYVNTGLHLVETDGIGLDRFDYLPEYDAYYHSHGDTNYRPQVLFDGGIREDDLVRLYYRDDFKNEGWKCLTLRESEEGSWHFVSHLPAEKPALPTVYPDGEPWRTVSLTGRALITPREVETARHEDDCAEWTGGWMTDNDVEVELYRSTDGNTYAAVVDDWELAGDGSRSMTRWQARTFLTLPETAEDPAISFFRDLFGYDGLIVSYEDVVPAEDSRQPLWKSQDYSWSGRYYYYYAFKDDGTPIQLAQCVGLSEPLIIDLDGNGENELLSWGVEAAELFFMRDGKHYAADVYGLFLEAWTDADVYVYDIRANRDYRCLSVTGSVTMPEWGPEANAAVFRRDVYFDGENLLIYKERSLTVTDHVADTVSAPDQVIADAKADLRDDTFPQILDDWADDWCLADCRLDSREYRHGCELEIYRAELLFHEKNPGQPMLTGGAYVREDGWAHLDHTQYLVYKVQEGRRELLADGLPYDYKGDLYRVDLEHGLRTPGELYGSELLWMIRTLGPWEVCNLLALYGEDVYEPALERLRDAAELEGYPGELEENLFTEAWPGRDGILTEEGRAACDYLVSILQDRP